MHMPHKKPDAQKMQKGFPSESIYGLIGRHPYPHLSRWFMRLTPSVIASTALPGRTAHVYTQSADSHISSVLGKATDIQYPLSL